MIRPLHDRVVVKPQTRTLSDVIYIENKEKFNQGIVLAVGPDTFDLKPGDFIKYGNGTYLDWPMHDVDGELVQIIQEADVACVVEA